MRMVAALLTGLVIATGASFAATSGWTHYSSDEFGFEAQFPAVPAVTTENKTLPVNGSSYVITMHTIIAKGANGSICLVVQTNYNWPIDIEGELAADRDNFVKPLNATVT